MGVLLISLIVSVTLFHLMAKERKHRDELNKLNERILLERCSVVITKDTHPMTDI